ncbi:uncharacterized protein LOC125226316 isoform X5 [Leguminivora glycinivorella]|uniref:uncharacterized protein LOC125226316 isoform X5 n=1 Tax=Leguminivora glycinivorella TaxID=1035111 RepID=UPI00200D936D|nr:uncharacterized protein LOC125226316 isoform X5 [Leguminivora glycinivorella]
MYRCIYLKPNQRYLQCIFWRENTYQPLQIYMLTTLSFGLKSAPHIATRCLLQLSNENKHTFPAAANALANQFYMDDFIAGGDDESQVVETASQVNEILQSANFVLRKWKSNSEAVLKRGLNQPTSWQRCDGSSPGEVNRRSWISGDAGHVTTSEHSRSARSGGAREAKASLPAPWSWYERSACRLACGGWARSSRRSRAGMVSPE